jgi:hypothetical protein
MVLFMCKEHVTKPRINIWPSQVYLSLGIFENFSKKFKKSKKKSSNFSKIKIPLCNSYARITKMLKFLKNSNFLLFFNSNWPKTNLLPRATQTRPYFLKTTFSRVLWGMSLIHPPLSPKKFIFLSGFAKNFKNFQLKVNFFCYKTLQIHCQCFSGI